MAEKQDKRRPVKIPKGKGLEELVENALQQISEYEETRNYDKAIEASIALLPYVEDKPVLFMNKQVALFNIAKYHFIKQEYEKAEKYFKDIAGKYTDTDLVNKELDKLNNKLKQGSSESVDEFEINDFYLKIISMDYLGLLYAEKQEFRESDRIFSDIFKYSHLIEKMDNLGDSGLLELVDESYGFNLGAVYLDRGIALQIKEKNPEDLYRVSIKYQLEHGRKPFLASLFALANVTKNKKERKKLLKQFAKQAISETKLKQGFFPFKGSRNIVFELGKIQDFLNIVAVPKVNKRKKPLKKEFDLLKKLHSLVPEYTAEPLVIIKNRIGITPLYFLFIERAPGNTVFEQFKNIAYEPTMKYGLIFKLTSVLAEYHDAGKSIKTKKPKKRHFTKKVDAVFLRYFGVKSRQRKEFLEHYKLVQEKLSKAPLDFYIDANLKNWNFHKGEIRKYDFEEAKALPCMLDLVSLLEFARTYLPRKKINEIVESYYEKRKSSLVITKKEFMYYYSVAALQRHLELAGYRMRDYRKESEAYNELTYSCYHLQSAIERAHELGFSEIKNDLEGIKNKALGKQGL